MYFPNIQAHPRGESAEVEPPAIQTAEAKAIKVLLALNALELERQVLAQHVSNLDRIAEDVAALKRLFPRCMVCNLPAGTCEHTSVEVPHA